MKPLYWDQLQWVVEAAQTLQRSPVGTGTEDEDERARQEAALYVLDARLTAAQESLKAMLLTVRPYVEIWCGGADDPGRGGRQLAYDWDCLLKGKS